MSNAVLGEVVERVQGNDGRMDLATLTISAGSGWLDQRERFSANIAGNEQKNYTLLTKGELSYNHGNSKLAKYGAVFVLRNYEEALVPRVYHSFKSNDDANADFIEYIFSSKVPDKELAKIVSSGARMDGLLNISFDEFMKIKLVLPKIDEQKKISHFFRQLDNSIILYQKELDALKKIKQGFLQKMFPKEGKTVPEVRFPGFTDDWEQHKLGEHADILTGGTPKTAIKLYWEPKEVPWMSSGEVNKKRIYDTDNKISKVGLENSSARWVNEKSVLIALAGQGKTRGMVAVNEIPLTTNQSIAAIEPDSTLYYEFLFCDLAKRYAELRMISSGDGTRGGLNKQIISELLIKAPSIEEQELIGVFFEQLDNAIILQQGELDLLKQTKNAFLQKLFLKPSEKGEQ